MRIKQGYLLKKIAGEYAAIPYDASYVESGAMISFNDTGAFLWKCLEEDCTADDLAIALQGEYQIKADLACDAVQSFLVMLRKERLLEE